MSSAGGAWGAGSAGPSSRQLSTKPGGRPVLECSGGRAATKAGRIPGRGPRHRNSLRPNNGRGVPPLSSTRRWANRTAMNAQVRNPRITNALQIKMTQHAARGIRPRAEPGEAKLQRAPDGTGPRKTLSTAPRIQSSVLGKSAYDLISLKSGSPGAIPAV